MEGQQERYVERLVNWHQTADRRIAKPDDAARLIDRLGVVTLFPVSPEVPNLFHAFMGDPEAATDSRHDSPSGEVYGWRWALGRREAAFYTAVVRNRPTWVSWTLLPAVLRVRGEQRAPEDLYEGGELSADAMRVADALQRAGGELTTGDLRLAARFPTGKPQRAAYLKAVHELDSHLLLAKVFSPDDLEMRHALVAVRYPEHARAARELTYETALDLLLRTYLSHAVYVVPAVLAKHLGVPIAAMREALDALAAQEIVAPFAVSGAKGIWYAWTGANTER